MAFIVKPAPNLRKEIVKVVKVIIQNVPLDTNPVRLGPAALKMDQPYIYMELEFITCQGLSSIKNQKLHFAC